MATLKKTNFHNKTTRIGYRLLTGTRFKVPAEAAPPPTFFDAAGNRTCLGSLKYWFTPSRSLLSRTSKFVNSNQETLNSISSPPMVRAKQPKRPGNDVPHSGPIKTAVCHSVEAKKNNPCMCAHCRKMQYIESSNVNKFCAHCVKKSANDTQHARICANSCLFFFLQRALRRASAILNSADQWPCVEHSAKGTFVMRDQLRDLRVLDMELFEEAELWGLSHWAIFGNICKNVFPRIDNIKRAKKPACPVVFVLIE